MNISDIISATFWTTVQLTMWKVFFPLSWAKITGRLKEFDKQEESS